MQCRAAGSSASEPSASQGRAGPVHNMVLAHGGAQRPASLRLLKALTFITGWNAAAAGVQRCTAGKRGKHTEHGMKTDAAHRNRWVDEGGAESDIALCHPACESIR